MRLLAKLGLIAVGAVGFAGAETGRDAWLRYAPLPEQARKSMPAVVASFGNSPLILTAQGELVRGVRGMCGRTLRITAGLPNESAFLLGTLDDLPGLDLKGPLQADAYLIKTVGRYTVITASNDRGVLYGVFALLRRMGTGQPLAALDERRTPAVPDRWINQWDNLDGTIERGYGGRSIFWDNGQARADLTRVGEYGRLLASIGVNVCAINNVNANLRVLTPDFLPQIARIAEAFRPWGVRVAISVDFGSPKSVGGLDSFDPLDKRVAAWWRSKVDEVYTAIPDLAGFVMKADSEGRVGPSAYGRTHADAANVVARALQPHGGLIFYRGFVYDHHMDWRNLKNDRARAAYDNFKDLDGKFDDNVVVQIKHGPIDFQVREPVSPLFGRLPKTHEAIELQITQEYMGQGRSLVYLAPMWKEAVDATKGIVRGFAGVANVGMDDSWFGNQMSQANLYAFGRLAWDPSLTSRQIVEEWTRLTFGNDPKVAETIDAMQLSSWRTYESYTGPLGLQTLTDIVGNHFGVAVEASENNGWGQWHRADAKGVGMDRTVATGTGYIGQYEPAKSKTYESLDSTPDDLLLFLHHVPYTYVLHSGKTVIQSLYDLHYEGAAAVTGYVEAWKTLRGRVDDRRFGQVLAQLQYQDGQAEVWRDAVTQWFWKESGIADSKGRVGHWPGRVEAESMKLDGYEVKAVTPWEAASGGEAVECAISRCTASFRYEGAPGWYAVRVRYFDQNDGVSKFRVSVGKQVIGEWLADDRLPTKKVDGTSSSLRVLTGIGLRKGDEITVEGIPDGNERAPLDYVEIWPEPPHLSGNRRMRMVLRSAETAAPSESAASHWRYTDRIRSAWRRASRPSTRSNTTEGCPFPVMAKWA
jgi:alpha-glucuronidase